MIYPATSKSNSFKKERLFRLSNHAATFTTSTFTTFTTFTTFKKRLSPDFRLSTFRVWRLSTFSRKNRGQMTSVFCFFAMVWVHVTLGSRPPGGQCYCRLLISDFKGGTRHFIGWGNTLIPLNGKRSQRAF